MDEAGSTRGMWSRSQHGADDAAECSPDCHHAHRLVPLFGAPVTHLGVTGGCDGQRRESQPMGRDDARVLASASSTWLHR
jgi:hypothetical protein